MLFCENGGYEATCDQKGDTGEHSAFIYTDDVPGLQSDKVIVILSAAYKHKADEPMTGVSGNMRS